MDTSTERGNTTTADNLGRNPEKLKIVLSDGKEYTLALFTINRLVDVEEHFGESISVMLKNGLRAKVARFLLYSLLKPNYPDMDEDELGELVTPDKLLEVYGIITKVLG